MSLLCHSEARGERSEFLRVDVSAPSRIGFKKGKKGVRKSGRTAATILCLLFFGPATDGLEKTKKARKKKFTRYRQTGARTKSPGPGTITNTGNKTG